MLAEPVFSGAQLRAVLGAAKEFVLRNGHRRNTPRGEAFSFPGVHLLWSDPVPIPDPLADWDLAACDRYISSFVQKRDENRPENLAVPGSLIFPYTYAARSRFWDGGWGYVLAVTRATREVGVSVADICTSYDSFRSYLRRIGQLVHLQIVLGVWDWMGKLQMERFLANPDIPASMMERSRIDQLERLGAEISNHPDSRRAITASFIYPDLDQRFDPYMGIPPYQHFQVLPSNTRQEALSSLHYHRSLDASNGAQLDFYHDFVWLRELSNSLERPVGSIGIVAADFHVYVELKPSIAGKREASRLDDWLIRVTDGYRADRDSVDTLLDNHVYQRNARKIFYRLGD